MCKRATAGFLLLLFAFTAFGQERDGEGYTPDDLKAKAAKYRGMQTAGFILLGSGGISLVGGFALMSSAGGGAARGSNGETGLVMTALGVPLAIAGTVLAIVGTEKYREYRDRANVSGWYDPIRRGAAISVTLAIPAPHEYQ